MNTTNNNQQQFLLQLLQSAMASNNNNNNVANSSNISLNDITSLVNNFGTMDTLAQFLNVNSHNNSSIGNNQLLNQPISGNFINSNSSFMYNNPSFGAPSSIHNETNTAVSSGNSFIENFATHNINNFNTFKEHQEQSINVPHLQQQQSSSCEINTNSTSSNKIQNFSDSGVKQEPLEGTTTFKRYSGPYTNRSTGISAPFVHEMHIPNDLIGCIIGRGGSKINEIRNSSKAHIKISNCEEGTKERMITITGDKEQILNAKAQINNSIELHKHLLALNTAMNHGSSYNNGIMDHNAHVASNSASLFQQPEKQMQEYFSNLSAEEKHRFDQTLGLPFGKISSLFNTGMDANNHNSDISVDVLNQYINNGMGMGASCDSNEMLINSFLSQNVNIPSMFESAENNSNGNSLYHQPNMKMMSSQVNVNGTLKNQPGHQNKYMPY